MKAIHDLGGIHGFGPIKMDSAQFHERWEQEVFVINKIIQVHGIYKVDEKRHASERIPPLRYLQLSYFEKWRDSIEMLLIEKGILTREDIDSRRESLPSGAQQNESNPDPDLTTKVLDSFKKDKLKEVEPMKNSFHIGDEVIVKSNNEFGHCRAPAYAQKSIEIIEQTFGTFPLPDAIVRGEYLAEPVYKVRFSAQELWGDSYPENDSITLDLWESYLSPTPS